MTLDSIEEQIGHAVRADLVRRDTGLEEALRRCERAGEAVFLFGADHATVHALRSRIRSAWPRLRLAGICDADFSGPAGPAILAHIAACAPDMVIADVAPKRHRVLIAEFASHGLRPGLVNLPGTFVRYLATHPGLADAAAASPPAARLPRPIAKAVAELAAIMRFSGIVARQIFLGAAPSHAARSYQVLRRDG